MKDKTKGKKNIITIETKTGIVCLNGYASESAHLYVELILEACARRKIDARDAIINTDGYPQLNKTAEVEFAIGWLHGLAEAHELDAEQIFERGESAEVQPPPRQGIGQFADLIAIRAGAGRPW